MSPLPPLHPTPSPPPTHLLFEDSWRPTHRVVLYQAETKAVHALTVMRQANGLAFTRHDWISRGRPLLIASADEIWTLDESAKQEHGEQVRLLKVEPILGSTPSHSTQVRAA